MISAVKTDRKKYFGTNKTAAAHSKPALQTKHNVTLPEAPVSFDWTHYVHGRMHDYQSIASLTHIKPGRG